MLSCIFNVTNILTLMYCFELLIKKFLSFWEPFVTFIHAALMFFAYRLSENDVSDKNSTKENTGKYLRTRPADFFAFLQRVHSFSVSLSCFFTELIIF